jgi:four helix bundle protein
MDADRKDDFRDLEVWQKCRKIRSSIWRLTRNFPHEEKYRLADQMIRATRSATACIAEGYGRYHYQENIQFCRQARGSLFELIDHADVAVECNYFDPETANKLIADVKNAIKLLNGYIRYLADKRASTK